MFSLPPSLLSSLLLSQLCRRQRNKMGPSPVRVRVRSPHYDCMFDERLNFSSFPSAPAPRPSLSEEDIKLKSPRSKEGNPSE